MSFMPQIGCRVAWVLLVRLLSSDSGGRDKMTADVGEAGAQGEPSQGCGFDPPPSQGQGEAGTNFFVAIEDSSKPTACHRYRSCHLAQPTQMSGPGDTYVMLITANQSAGCVQHGGG